MLRESGTCRSCRSVVRCWCEWCDEAHSCIVDKLRPEHRHQAGLPHGRVDAALDSELPREALIALLLERRPVSAPSIARHSTTAATVAGLGVDLDSLGVDSDSGAAGPLMEPEPYASPSGNGHSRRLRQVRSKWSKRWCKMVQMVQMVQTVQMHPLNAVSHVISLTTVGRRVARSGGASVLPASFGQTTMTKMRTTRKKLWRRAAVVPKTSTVTQTNLSLWKRRATKQKLGHITRNSRSRGVRAATGMRANRGAVMAVQLAAMVKTGCAGGRQCLTRRQPWQM